MLTLFFFLLMMLNSCAYFEEEEVILPGKRINVFEKSNDKLYKSNLVVELPDPKLIEDWPFQNQNSLNSLSHFKSNDEIKIKWILKSRLADSNSEGFIAKPITYKNIIYTISSDSVVFARNESNGKILWELPLNEENEEEIFFTGGLAANSNNIYITTGLGNVISMEANSGKINWKKRFQMPISSAPLISSNKLFIIFDDNQTLAIDEKNGEEIWSHIGNLENVSIIGGVSPALSKSILYVTYSSGEIFALNSTNGSVLWYENLAEGNIFSRNLISDIQSPAVIHKDLLLVSSYINKFVAIRLADGERLWEIDLSTLNPIVTSGNYIYLIDIENKLHCITLNDGKIIWSAQLKSKSSEELIRWVGPLLTSNKLIVASSEGVFLSISPFDGRVLSQINSEHKFISQPIQSKFTIYFISEKGNLVALE